jgi:hypothetical protein
MSRRAPPNQCNLTDQVPSDLTVNDNARHLALVVEDSDASSERVLCQLKTGPFLVRVFCRRYPWLGEELRPEGIEVQGRAEGVRYQAKWGRHAGRGDLPQGWDQPGDLLQLEEEIRRADAVLLRNAFGSGDAAPA